MVAASVLSAPATFPSSDSAVVLASNARASAGHRPRVTLSMAQPPAKITEANSEIQASGTERARHVATGWQPYMGQRCLMEQEDLLLPYHTARQSSSQPTGATAVVQCCGVLAFLGIQRTVGHRAFHPGLQPSSPIQPHPQNGPACTHAAAIMSPQPPMPV